MMPLATTRSMTFCDSRIVLAALSLSPAATAFTTFLIAERTVVRRLMLWVRRWTA
jgi:hypothetical protein